MYDAAVGRWHVVDPLSERYYHFSMYAYVLNNPIRRIDIYGLTDWDGVLKGTAVAVGGLLGTVGGIAACLTPTGVGQVGGGALISLSIPSMGLGTAMIIQGFSDKPIDDVPSGVIESLGMAGDAMVGNENDELRNVGAVGDIAATLGLGGLPKTATEATILGVEVYYTTKDIVEDVKSEQNTESQTSEESKDNETNFDEFLQRDKTVESDQTNIQSNIPLIK